MLPYPAPMAEVRLRPGTPEDAPDVADLWQRGWRDAADLPDEVEALGRRFVSPCRRYEKRVTSG